MAVEIPNGAAVSYHGTWPQSLSGSFGIGSDVADIGRQLLDDGLAIITYNRSVLGILGGGAYDIDVQILNQSGQDLDDTDLVSQVADAVNQVTGAYPQAGVVTSVTHAGSGVNTGTGQAAPQQTVAGVALGATQAAATKTHQCGDPTWSFFDDPGQWLTCLTTKGLTTIGLLAIGLIIGVILIVAGPKVAKGGL